MSIFGVAPFAGAWIEIPIVQGLCIPKTVAPFAGAWIEIFVDLKRISCCVVAPFAGAWIEIVKVMLTVSNLPKSLPLRERGLKLLVQLRNP